MHKLAKVIYTIFGFIGKSVHTMTNEHKFPAQVFSLADQCWNSGGSIMLRAEGQRRKARQIKLGKHYL